MIKEALKYIVGLSETKTQILNGAIYSDKLLFPVYEEVAEPIHTTTLGSIVDYIKNGVDGGEYSEKIVIHISSPTNVSVFSELYGDSKKRDSFLTVAAEIPVFSFEKFYDAESFNIKMQSIFLDTNDKEAILLTIGNLKDSAVKTTSDDGISQTVTVKTGIAAVGEAKVPNPVELKPYRTFTEVAQPSSSFVFRMKEGGYCGLFEADGGAWKRIAIESIKIHLEHELAEEMKGGKIVILS